jgi:uncharacterized protein YacL
MALVILRCLFLAVAIALGFQLTTSSLVTGENKSPSLPWLGFLGVMLIAVAVLAADYTTKRKRLDTITAVIFGMFIGLILTYVFRIVLTPWLEGADQMFVNWLQLGIATIVCYGAISVLLQTKDDFRFIIPYVEFAKEVKGLKPYVLDTSVVIDGRIADIVETRVFDNQLSDRRVASNSRLWG